MSDKAEAKIKIPQTKQSTKQILQNQWNQFIKWKQSNKNTELGEWEIYEMKTEN